MRVAWLAAGAIAVSLGSAGTAQAGNYYASDSGAGDCSSAGTACTIQTALGLIDNNADGDTLFLAPGDYNDTDDVLDVDGAGFDGLTIEGAGRDVAAGGTRLNADPAANSTVPFQFGDQSTNQTVRDLTLAASPTSTATETVTNISGSLTLQNVDVHGPLGKNFQSVIRASGETPELDLENSRVFLDAQGATIFGGTAVFYTSDVGAGEGALTVRGSTVDVVTNGHGAGGIDAEGDTDAVIDKSVVRLRRTAGTAAQQADGIYFQGAVPGVGPLTVSPTLVVKDTAIAGGRAGVEVGAGSSPMTDANMTATATIARTSIDVGDIGVADPYGSPNYVVGISGGVFVEGQSLDLTIRDVVDVDGISTIRNGNVTLQVTCENTFFGSATNFDDPDSCANTNTGAIGTQLPDLTAANAWSTSGTAAAAVATAFMPGPGSVLLETATGTDAPATDLAGNPRAVDAGDPDCIAQVDRGAYERQGLAGPSDVCNPLPPCTTCGGGGGVVKPPAVVGTISGLRFSKSVLGFSLSAPAVVTAKLERQDKGRRKGKKCVKQTRKNRKKKACKRYVKVGKTVTRTAAAGANKIPLRAFTKKRLKKGRYRMTLSVRGGKTYRLAIRVRR